MKRFFAMHSCTVALLCVLAAPIPSMSQGPDAATPDKNQAQSNAGGAAGQQNQSTPQANTQLVPQSPGPAPRYDRPVSWKLLLPNIGHDQVQIWSFPAKPVQGKHWVPTVSVLAATAGLIALDPGPARYFRESSTYNGFNRVFSGNNTVIGTIVAPVSLYAVGLVRHDKKMTGTALLAGQAVADSEIVATVLKDATRRLRPQDIPVNGNFSDSWFESKGSFLRGNGSFPSGHAIAAFSVATIIARRYGNHRWVPYVSYGAAALVGFSRLTLSAHFMSDVFMGSALGYSISRFAVLQQ